MQVSNPSLDPTFVVGNDLTSALVVRIGPPVHADEIIDIHSKDKSNEIVLAINVSQLELCNVLKMKKIDWIVHLTMLTKLVLKGNEVTNFPSMKKLLVLNSVHISNMHHLKRVGKELGSAPALCSLDVHNCGTFKNITKAFIVGVTAGSSLRFHTLRVTRSPLIMIDSMAKLAGLRILYIADTWPLQIKFPALGSFLHLEELTVKHNSYSIFSPLEELACLTSLKRLVLQNLPIQSVEGISALTALEYLRLSDIDISRLPDEMGQMTQLRTLKIIRCDWLEDLPTSIATLPLLESFSVSTTQANIRMASMFPDTFMFRRVARMLPFMKRLKSLQVAGLEDEEGAVLAHALQTWPPPLLAKLHCFPHLYKFVPADQYGVLMHAWDCMAVVEVWQGQVFKSEAFVCGTHAVMGRESFVSWLNKDMVRTIVSHVLGRVPPPFSISDLVYDQQFGSS